MCNFQKKYDFLKDVYGNRLKLAEQIEKAETLSERNRLKTEYKQKFNGEEYIDTKSLEKKKKHNKELNNNQITLEIIKTVLEHPDDIEKEYAKYFANENSGIDYTTNPNNKKGRNKQPSIFGPTKFVASKVIEVAKLYLASIPFISQIKGAYGKYTTGNKDYDQQLKEFLDISDTKTKMLNPYNKNEIIRDGYTVKKKGTKQQGYIINDDIFNHYDVGKIDVNLDVEGLLGNGLIVDMEQDRYKCSNDNNGNKGNIKFNDIWRRQGGKAEISNINTNNIEALSNGHILFKDHYKKKVLKMFNKKTDDFIECIVKNNLDKISITFGMHRDEKKVDDYFVENMRPEDFKNIFEKLMLKKNIKNILISELSCYEGIELIETLAKVIKETGFEGNIIIRRNKNYDKPFHTKHEVSIKKQVFENKAWYYNRYSTSGYEYIVCNKDGCKCIKENEAREIMGGSYKQNLDFNKKHGLGGKPANQKCQPEMDFINKKYFEKGENKIKNDNADMDIEDEKEVDYGLDNL